MRKTKAQFPQRGLREPGSHALFSSQSLVTHRLSLCKHGHLVSATFWWLKFFHLPYSNNKTVICSSPKTRLSYDKNFKGKVCKRLHTRYPAPAAGRDLLWDLCVPPSSHHDWAMIHVSQNGLCLPLSRKILMLSTGFWKGVIWATPSTFEWRMLAVESSQGVLLVVQRNPSG